MVSSLLMVIMLLVIRVRASKNQLSVHESEALLELGYHSVTRVIESAISEATQKDNYWVVRLKNGGCAIVTPYLVGGKWSYRHTSLWSHSNWIDANRSESELLKAPSEGTPSQDEVLNLIVGEDQFSVQGLIMPVSDRYDVRLSWWLEDEGAKISPRAIQSNLDKNNLASFEKVPGITDYQEPWQKVANYFNLDEDKFNLWESLIRKWQNRELPEDELKYQLKEAAFSNLFLDFMDKSVSFHRLPYTQQARVPLLDWTINAGVADTKKSNLNAYIDKDRAKAINELADYTLNALPNWDNRKGGFPENYTKTIIANILDYADRDDLVSSKTGEYRGVDSSPWINEWVTRYETQREWNTKKEDYDYKFIISQYAELWNMNYNQVEGELEVSYEPGFEMISSTGEKLPLAHTMILRDRSDASHDLTFNQLQGKWVFPKKSIKLAPNEHSLIKLGSISYDLENIGADFYEIEGTKNAVTLKRLHETYRVASYRAWWNGQIVDRAGWSDANFESVGLAQRTELKVYTQGSTKSKVKTKLYQPSHRYASGSQYRQSFGDPRMSYYAGAQQSSSLYPDNYSPHRRNVKLQLYAKDSNYKLNPSTRVLISDWSDGGHSSNYHPNHSFDQQSNTTATQTIHPDDSVFLENKQEDLPAAAVSKLSNRGYLLSETELGAIFDPVMWSSTQIKWVSYIENSIKNIDKKATPSFVVGGGNTLRIGRAEHPLFNEEGTRASHLLDIFHTGRGWDATNQIDELRGSNEKVNGAINLNTASQEVIEILLYGILETDNNLSEKLTDRHDDVELLRPPTRKIEQQQRQLNIQKIAKAIVDFRQNNIIRSVTQVLDIFDKNGQPLFANISNYHNLGRNIQANDTAQEELFARLYNQSTVRSKNFRAYTQVELLNKQGDVVGIKRKKMYIYINSANSDSTEVVFMNESSF